MIPQLARSEWPAHPRWPAQTLLLSSHESFRGWSRWIGDRVRVVATGDPRRRARWLARLEDDFGWWTRGMRSHERYEETKLYPFLADRWGATFGDLEAGHRALGRARDAVFAGYAAIRAGAADAHDILTAALGEHGQILLAHLDAEELRVIPLLLELDPTEFSKLVAPPPADPQPR